MTNQDNAMGAHIDNLNGLLADYYALFLKTKNFHWHVSGPHFRDLHLMFDEQAQEIMGVTDAVAERVRKQGGTTLTSIGSIAAKTQLKDQDNTDLDALKMVEELRDDNLKLVDKLRDVKLSAEAVGDNATDGIVDDWTDQAEERAWFLTETMR